MTRKTMKTVNYTWKPVTSSDRDIKVVEGAIRDALDASDRVVIRVLASGEEQFWAEAHSNHDAREIAQDVDAMAYLLDETVQVTIAH